MSVEHITHGQACIECSLFSQGTGVTECFAMIHVSDATLTFEQQLESVRAAYFFLLRHQLPGSNCVFRRYFLSDASNQSSVLMATEIEDPIGEVSVIQQPPLDGTKVALWAYIMTNVKVQALANGLTEVSHGAYRHLWNASMYRHEANSEYQTRIILNDFIMQLIEAGCSMERNCIRTWFFVNEVDNNYAGMVKARAPTMWPPRASAVVRPILTSPSRWMPTPSTDFSPPRCTIFMRPPISAVLPSMVLHLSAAPVSTMATAVMFSSRVQPASVPMVRYFMRAMWSGRPCGCWKTWRRCSLRPVSPSMMYPI